MRHSVGAGRRSGAARPLFSFLLLVVAGVSALTSSSYATFSNDAQGRGPARAGTVDVVVNDDPDDVATFTFEGPSCDRLAFGESCSAPVVIHNAGTLAATYNVRVVDSGDSCFTSRLSSEKELETGVRAPGERISGTLTTTLDSDAPHCNGLRSRSNVIVTARQARTPHSS